MPMRSRCVVLVVRSKGITFNSKAFGYEWVNGAVTSDSRVHCVQKSKTLFDNIHIMKMGVSLSVVFVPVRYRVHDAEPILYYLVRY